MRPYYYGGYGYGPSIGLYFGGHRHGHRHHGITAIIATAKHSAVIAERAGIEPARFACDQAS